MAYINYKKTTTPATDGSEEQKNEVATTTMSMEALLDSPAVKSLGKSLCLTQTQLAKANSAVLKLQADPKLAYCSAMSKVRYAYSVATLNYANPNATCPVAYGKNISCQVQYYGLLEDLKDCEQVEEVNWCRLYKDQKYDVIINKNDNKEIKNINEIKLDDPFQELTVIGYYCACKLKNGKTYTSLMSVNQCKEWARKYSISFKAFEAGKASSAIWNDMWDDMCIKTQIRIVARKVLKEFPVDRVQKALEIDQAIFTENGMEYADNPQNAKTNNSTDCQVKNTLQPKEPETVDIKDIPVDNPLEETK